MMQEANEISIKGKYCHYHPDQKAKWICTTCKALFCENCVEHKKVGKFTANICPREECRGRCMAVEIHDVSGSIKIIEQDKDKEKNQFSLKLKAKQYLSKYYLSLAVPTLVLILYDIFRYMDNRKPFWWVIVVWAGLIFLMTARNYVAYMIMTVLNAVFALQCIYGITSIMYNQDDSQLLNKSFLALWILSFLILIYSYREFSD
jgi:B-box zinc finger protein